MRPRIGMAGLFVATLGIFLLATVPISFVLEKSGARQAGLRWEAAEGTLFKSQISGLHYAKQSIGNVELAFTARTLLKGRLGYDFNLQGAAGTGYGHIAFAQETVSISGLTARLDLGALVYLVPDIRNTNGSGHVNAVVLEMSHNKCRSASGVLSTDLVSKLAEKFALNADEMRGTLACEEGVLAINMTGRIAQGDALRAQLRLSLLEPSELEAIVETDDIVLIAGLSSYGFVEVPDGLRYYRELVPLKGL